MELVRIWVRVLGGSELVDVAGANLEILLLPRHQSQCLIARLEMSL
jgi:hypothetical protein